MALGKDTEKQPLLGLEHIAHVQKPGEDHGHGDVGENNSFLMTMMNFLKGI